MSFFRFCQFDIYQQDVAHRVGTDAMLLGSWTHPSEGPILDVGTGTGVLALMLAQRSAQYQAQIEALEPHQASAEQARANIAASPWPQIQVTQSRLQDYQTETRYQLIVCNPPYFDEPTRATGQARHTARHIDDLNHADLLNHTLSLLAARGRLALVLPLRHAETLIKEAQLKGLQLQRRCDVRHSVNHPVKRLLLELSLSPAIAPEQTELCIRNPDGSYSADYRKLTEQYHTLAPPPDYKRQAQIQFPAKDEI